ncbi:hypothetical protein Leryth_016980 [Lithospermum erythrorhizon]|nr:hypothetical protein Leryth_016980 [Lithospermum erythrorhizon]
MLLYDLLDYYVLMQRQARNMSFTQARMQRGPIHGNSRPLRSHYDDMSVAPADNSYDNYHNNQRANLPYKHYNFSSVLPDYNHNSGSWFQPEVVPPPSKKRKFSTNSFEDTRKRNQHCNAYDNGGLNYPITLDNGPHTMPDNYLSQSNHDISFTIKNALLGGAGITRKDPSAHTSTSSKRSRSEYEDGGDVVFMSRDEIEKRSPSRKDGIDSLHEMHLRYSYCAFLQSLGIRLELPQTTIGTAMVLCHRFFVHRSHASHDRFLIATAALFLAAKSEETARPLNDVLRLSCETFHKQDISLLSYVLPIDWFEQYRERITEAEQLILTTLNFELGVQHPYDPLLSTLKKLGYSQSGLVHMALNLVSEGVNRRISVLTCMIFLAGG